MGMRRAQAGSEAIKGSDLTYLSVSGVALPFSFGPSEPTSGSALVALGAMMEVDADGRSVMMMGLMFD